VGGGSSPRGGCGGWVPSCVPEVPVWAVPCRSWAPLVPCGAGRCTPWTGCCGRRRSWRSCAGWWRSEREQPALPPKVRMRGHGAVLAGGQESRPGRFDIACPCSGAVLDAEGGRPGPLGPLRGGAQHLHVPRGTVPAGAQCPVRGTHQ